jgi:hypothetical protein
MEVPTMPQIPLSQNKFAIVDEEDYPIFSEFRWCYRAERNHGPGCAVRHVKKPNGKDTLSYLHREVMGSPPDKEVIFLNHDRLDCRKANLKIVSKQEANWHHRARKDSESGLKGLKYNSSARKWYAFITRHGEFHHLGAFETLAAAKDAYKSAEERLSQPPAETSPTQEDACHG